MSDLWRDPDIAFDLVCNIDGSGGSGYWPADPELVEMYWRDQEEQRARMDITPYESEWLERLKQTMAVELSRGMTQGIPPKGLIDLLLGIPEVRQGLEMRAKGRPR